MTCNQYCKFYTIKIFSLSLFCIYSFKLSDCLVQFTRAYLNFWEKIFDFFFFFGYLDCVVCHWLYARLVNVGFMGFSRNIRRNRSLFEWIHWLCLHSLLNCFCPASMYSQLRGEPNFSRFSRRDPYSLNTACYELNFKSYHLSINSNFTPKPCPEVPVHHPTSNLHL